MIIFRIVKLCKTRNYIHYSQLLLKNPIKNNLPDSTLLLTNSNKLPESKINISKENNVSQNYFIFREEQKILQNISEFHMKLMTTINRIDVKNHHEMCKLDRYIDHYCEKYLVENESMLKLTNSLIANMANKSKKVQNCFFEMQITKLINKINQWKNKNKINTKLATLCLDLKSLIIQISEIMKEGHNIGATRNSINPMIIRKLLYIQKINYMLDEPFELDNSFLMNLVGDYYSLSIDSKIDDSTQLFFIKDILKFINKLSLTNIKFPLQLLIDKMMELDLDPADSLDFLDQYLTLYNTEGFMMHYLKLFESFMSSTRSIKKVTDLKRSLNLIKRIFDEFPQIIIDSKPETTSELIKNITNSIIQFNLPSDDLIDFLILINSNLKNKIFMMTEFSKISLKNITNFNNYDKLLSLYLSYQNENCCFDIMGLSKKWYRTNVINYGQFEQNISGIFCKIAEDFKSKENVHPHLLNLLSQKFFLFSITHKNKFLKNQLYQIYRNLMMQFSQKLDINLETKFQIAEVINHIYLLGYIKDDISDYFSRIKSIVSLYIDKSNLPINEILFLSFFSSVLELEQFLISQNVLKGDNNNYLISILGPYIAHKINNFNRNNNSFQKAQKGFPNNDDNSSFHRNILQILSYLKKDFFDAHIFIIKPYLKYILAKNIIPSPNCLDLINYINIVINSGNHILSEFLCYILENISLLLTNDLQINKSPKEIEKLLYSFFYITVQILIKKQVDIQKVHLKSINSIANKIFHLLSKREIIQIVSITEPEDTILYSINFLEKLSNLFTNEKEYLKMNFSDEELFTLLQGLPRNLQFLGLSSLISKRINNASLKDLNHVIGEVFYRKGIYDLNVENSLFKRLNSTPFNEMNDLLHLYLKYSALKGFIEPFKLNKINKIIESLFNSKYQFPIDLINQFLIISANDDKKGQMKTITKNFINRLLNYSPYTTEKMIGGNQIKGFISFNSPITRFYKLLVPTSNIQDYIEDVNSKKDKLKPYDRKYMESNESETIKIEHQILNRISQSRELTMKNNSFSDIFNESLSSFDSNIKMLLRSSVLSYYDIKDIDDNNNNTKIEIKNSFFEKASIQNISNKFSEFLKQNKKNSALKFSYNIPLSSPSISINVLIKDKKRNTSKGILFFPNSVFYTNLNDKKNYPKGFINLILDSIKKKQNLDVLAISEDCDLFSSENFLSIFENNESLKNLKEDQKNIEPLKLI